MTFSGLSAGYEHGAPGTPTYQWQSESKAGGSWAFVNPISDANQSVTATDDCVNQTDTIKVYCKVTDAQGNTSPSHAIELEATFNSAQPFWDGTMVAGEDTDGQGNTYIGFNPLLSPPMGSMSPSTDYYSHAVDYLDWYDVSGVTGLELGIAGASSKGYFQTLYINGSAYPSSSASFSPVPGGGAWTWPSPASPFISADSYDITIVY